MDGIKCVLLDIEGTVCPISFVKETLFPYAVEALPGVLANKWNDADFLQYRDDFPEQHRRDPESLRAHVEDLTRRDVKIAYLKNLQGYLWENGYRTGAYMYSTPLFPDVTAQLKRWKDDGYALAIYSSGSVFAQKLLFGHVQSPAKAPQKRGRAPDEAEDHTAAPPAKKRAADDAESRQEVAARDSHQQEAVQTDGAGNGTSSRAESDARATKSTSEGRDVTDGEASRRDTEDLTAWFDGWYDTTNAGLKTEASSYAKIAKDLKHDPETILFLSDNVKEVDAALQANMKAILVDRPGNAPVSSADKQRLKVVQSLREISLREETAQSTESQATAQQSS